MSSTERSQYHDWFEMARTVSAFYLRVSMLLTDHFFAGSTTLNFLKQ